MQKIIRKAGLEPWPKLFHNLRASRETELAAEHPMHVVCEWIGNSPKVAKEHYLRVTDADFDKAIASAEGAQESAPESAREAQKGQRQSQQPTAAWDGLLLQIVEKALKNDEVQQVAATLAKAVQASAEAIEYPRQDSNL